MNADLKLFKWIVLLLLLPLGLAIFGGDSFRYPCQDPANWDKEMCQLPLCDVTRTCPQHIFKGQNDPRLGPDGGGSTPKPTITPAQTTNGGCK